MGCVFQFLCVKYEFWWDVYWVLGTLLSSNDQSTFMRTTRSNWYLHTVTPLLVYCLPVLILCACLQLLLTVDVLLVSLESVHLLHGPNIVHFDQMVPRRGQQPIPIPVPLHWHHCCFVGVAVHMQIFMCVCSRWETDLLIISTKCVTSCSGELRLARRNYMLAWPFSWKVEVKRSSYNRLTFSWQEYMALNSHGCDALPSLGVP